MSSDEEGIRWADFPDSSRAESGQELVRSDPFDDPPLPDNVVQLWDRLELRDGATITCLEAIVRSVRMDATAPVHEVAMRYIEARTRGELALTRGEKPHYPSRDPRVLQSELLQSVLPSIAAAGLVSLPANGLSEPGALLTIANPWLRLGLLEAGLIRLDLSVDAAGVQPPSGGAPTKAAPPRPESKLEDEWAQLWFAVQRHEWITLAVVSASPDEGGFQAASMLAAAGRRYGERAVDLIDASNLAPAAVDAVLASMSGAAARGTQLIIALDNPLSNPSVIPIARHASIALLSVRLGASTLASTRRSMQVIGREHFIGSVALK